MYVERAARKEDPIEHSDAVSGGLVGAAIGLAVGALFVAGAVFVEVLTVGLATPFVLGAAALIIPAVMTGKALGQSKGAGSSSKAGEIAEGARRTFIGRGQHDAARMSDPVTCHDDESIADGSVSVFIERWNASRRKDGTTCDGKIADGSPTVLFGGATIGRWGTADRQEPQPFAYKWGFIALDYAGVIISVITGKKIAIKVVVGLAGGMKFIADTTENKPLGYAADIISGIAGAFDGNPRLAVFLYPAAEGAATLGVKGVMNWIAPPEPEPYLTY